LEQVRQRGTSQPKLQDLRRDELRSIYRSDSRESFGRSPNPGEPEPAK
jgi:hypothetical protein